MHNLLFKPVVCEGMAVWRWMTSCYINSHKILGNCVQTNDIYLLDTVYRYVFLLVT